MHRKLKTKNKKLEKIIATEKRVKSGDLANPTEEQLVMLSGKDALKADMASLEETLAMYKEAFPNLKAWNSSKSAPKK